MTSDPLFLPMPTPPGPDADAGSTAEIRDDRPAPPPARSTVRNVMDLLYSQVGTWVLSFAIAAVQPRFLGPTGQGQLRLSLALWTVGQVVMGVGTSMHLTLSIARDRERGGSIVAPVLLLRVLGFVVTSIPIAAFVALRPGTTRTEVVVLTLGGVGALLASLAGTARAALMGYEHMRSIAVADVLTKVLHTVVVLGVLIGGGKAAAVAAVSLVSTAVNGVLLFRSLRRFGPIRAAVRPADLAAVARRSAPFLAAEAILVMYMQVDSIVLSLLVGPEELGWYGASDTLFASLLFVPTIVLSSLFPVIGRLHVENPERLRELVRRAFSTLLLAGLPIGIGTLVVAPALATQLYGAAFRPSGQVLAVLGPSVVLVSMTILLGQLAIGTGRQRVWNLTMLAATLVSIPLDLVLVPIMDDRYGNGALAGALSYLITETGITIVGLITIAPYLIDRDALVRLMKLAAATGLMAVAILPLRERFVLLPALIGVLVYGAIVIASRALSCEERAQALRLLDRVGGRLFPTGRGAGG